MSNSTPAMPGGVVPGWRHIATGPPEPCVFGDGPTVCRSPVAGVPCHQACAETWITKNAANPADLAQLIRTCTPVRGR
jgi:hypothetical protein